MYITRAILKFGKRYHLHMKKTVMMGLVMMIISSLWMLSVGGVVAVIAVGEQRNSRNFVMAISLAVVISIIKFISKKLENRMIHENSVAFKKEVRVDLMKKLFEMGPMLYDEERTGKLANMIWMKVDWLEYYYNEYLPKSVSMIILHTIMTVIYTSVLGVWGLLYPVCMLFVMLTPNLFHKSAMERGREEWEAESEYSSDSLDGIQGIATLKALNYVEKHQEIMRHSTKHWFDVTMRNLRLTTFENNFMSFFIQLAKFSIILVLGIMLHKSGVSEIEFILYLFLTIGVTDETYAMLAAWIKGAKGISGVDEIMEFIHSAEENQLLRKSQETGKNQNEIKEIQFKNVSFAYQTENVLENVSIPLKKGKTTAIVGASGSGKSTLAYLLSGFYQPKEGRIECVSEDDCEETFINRDKQVTAVWQDSRVFHMSVYQNILMGNCEKTMEDVIAAAKKANIHERILALPEGYQTVIGDGGEGLSGGEKQRIIIARAILKDTPVLILDEATAYLDGQNEKQIQNCVRELSKGKAVLTIAHRLDTVKAADIVYFIKKGRVFASGTHEELIKESTEYQKLFGIVG